MFNINSGDMKRLERDMKLLMASGGVVQKAIPMSVNRVLTSAKSVGVKAISKETGIKQKTVRSRIMEHKAKGGSFSAHLDAKTGRAFNLITSVPKGQRKPGVFNRRLKKGKAHKFKGVRAKAWAKQKVYRGTFILNTSKGPIVGSRKDPRKGRQSRIKFIAGPSIRNEFNSPGIRQTMRAKVDERLPIELQRAINFQKKRVIKR